MRSSSTGTVALVALLLGACSPGGMDGSAASAPSESPTAAARTAALGATPGTTPEPSSTVLATYERYLDATIAAMESGDPQSDELTQTSQDQALTAAQARVANLVAQDRTARGRFLPTVQSLEIEGAIAEIRDCYRADITEHDVDSGEQVADRAGARFAASAELEQLADGRWMVVAFREGDPCVPSELAREIEDRYREFWDALAIAGSPPDPEHPALADVAAGEQLNGLREQLRRFRDAGHEVRDESASHPTTLRVSDHDTVANVRDCRELDPEGGVYESSTGELVDGGARPGQRALWKARLELISGSWKVVDADLVAEDSACDV